MILFEPWLGLWELTWSNLGVVCIKFCSRRERSLPIPPPTELIEVSFDGLNWFEVAKFIRWSPFMILLSPSILSVWYLSNVDCWPFTELPLPKLALLLIKLPEPVLTWWTFGPDLTFREACPTKRMSSLTPRDFFQLPLGLSVALLLRSYSLAWAKDWSWLELTCLKDDATDLRSLL